MEHTSYGLANCVIVIPALDPDQTLPAYAAALLEQFGLCASNIVRQVREMLGR